MQQRLYAAMGQKGKREFVAISSKSSSCSLGVRGHLYSRTFKRGSSVFHLLRYAMSEGKRKKESRMRPHHLRTVVAFTPMGIKKKKVRPNALLESMNNAVVADVFFPSHSTAVMRASLAFERECAVVA
jgi:hypothetical protein